MFLEFIFVLVIEFVEFCNFVENIIMEIFEIVGLLETGLFGA
jgi:hypothetical protein